MAAVRCVLLGVIATVIAQSSQSRTKFEYVLQTVPLSFIEEPDPKTVLLNSTVTFHCSTAAMEPLPYYPSYCPPRLLWRLNNNQVVPSANIIIITSPDLSTSQLQIASVSESDAGYYQCVVEDGISMAAQDNCATGGPANYITVSRPALLDIITVAALPSQATEEAVEAPVGGWLLLPCHTGTSQAPSQAQWWKDGDTLNQTSLSGGWDVLYNGSLLVFTASSDVEGTYQCRGWFPGGGHLDSPSYNVTLSQGPTAAPVLEVILDVLAGEVIAGAPLNLTCYTPGLAEGSNHTLTLSHDDSLLDTVHPVSAMRHHFSIPSAQPEHAGTYSCSLLQSGITVQQSTVEVSVISPPTLVQQELVNTRLIDMAGLPHSEITNNQRDYVDIRCRSSGPAAELILYKDGVNISDDVTFVVSGVWRYSASSSYRDLLGVYQCFAINTAGSAHTFTRVLAFGFANPPVNLTCTATFQRGSQSPIASIKWLQPELDTLAVNRLREYAVGYQRDLLSNPDFEWITENTSSDYQVAVVNLTTEDDYVVTVFINNINHNSAPIDGPITECRFHTFDRYPVSELQVDCPLDAATPIHVEWRNPAGDYGNEVRLASISISGNCVNDPLNISSLGFFSDFLLGSDDREVYTLPSNSIEAAPGDVCTFTGSYRLASGYRRGFVIPPVSCAVPLPTSEATTTLPASTTTLPASTTGLTTTAGPTMSYVVTVGAGTTPGPPVWWAVLLSVVLVVVAGVALLVLTLVGVVCLRRRKRQAAMEQKHKLVEVIAGPDVISSDTVATPPYLFHFAAGYLTDWDTKSSASTIYDRLHDDRSTEAQNSFPPRYISDQDLGAGASLVMDRFFKSQSLNSADPNSSHGVLVQRTSSTSNVLAKAINDSENGSKMTKPTEDSARESLNNDSTSYELGHKAVNYMYSAGSSSGYGTDNYFTSDYNSSIPEPLASQGNSSESGPVRFSKSLHMLPVCEEEKSRDAEEMTSTPPSDELSCGYGTDEDLSKLKSSKQYPLEKLQDLGSTVLLTPSIEDINPVDSRFHKAATILSPTSNSEFPYTDGKGYVHMDTPSHHQSPRETAV